MSKGIWTNIFLKLNIPETNYSFEYQHIHRVISNHQIKIKFICIIKQAFFFFNFIVQKSALIIYIPEFWSNLKVRKISITEFQCLLDLWFLTFSDCVATYSHHLGEQFICPFTTNSTTAFSNFLQHVRK